MDQTRVAYVAMQSTLYLEYIGLYDYELDFDTASTFKSDVPPNLPIRVR